MPPSNTDVENFAHALVRTGDSHDAAADRFMDTVGELFTFLRQINAYIGTMRDGEMPVSESMLMIAELTLGGLSHTTRVRVVSEFTKRAFANLDHIVNHDADHLARIAPTLFPELPEAVISSLSRIILDDCLDADTISDVFDYVDSLMRIAIKRAAMVTVSGTLPDDSPPVGEIAVALEKMSLV